MRRSIVGSAIVVASMLAVVRPALAEDPQFGFQVSVDNGGEPLAPLLPVTDFTVRPSITSSTLGAGVRTLPLVIVCFNIFTGEIINNCAVNIAHVARAGSGGHSHTAGTRPKGSFQPSSGSTGTSGLATTYTSPEPSGIIDVTLTGTAPDGTPIFPSTFTIGVQIAGLVALGAGANYDLVGVLPAHPDSHYGTPAMNGALTGIADAYAMAFPGARLAINDMSIEPGGLFDYRGTWAPPHVSHRLGNDADLNLVPVARRRQLRQMITAAGLRIIPEGVETHWHVRQ
ncbi:MAG TPA: hypothetical protein VFP91_02815 [Vicinamibacterales bacterium]|nr:hypothetical protein [Vicinamibacterales bacterium]